MRSLQWKQDLLNLPRGAEADQFSRFGEFMWRVAGEASCPPYTESIAGADQSPPAVQRLLTSCSGLARRPVHRLILDAVLSESWEKFAPLATASLPWRGTRGSCA